MMLPGMTKYLDMVDTKEKKMRLPNVWAIRHGVTAKVDLDAAKNPPLQPVVASLDMGDEVAGAGICPECKSPMEEAHIGEDPVMVCMADRITLPIKDAETSTEEGTPEA